MEKKVAPKKRLKSLWNRLRGVDGTLIWWLSQHHCEMVAERGMPLPNYMQREFRSRWGRAGRCRLWVPRDIPVEEIEWPEDDPLATILERLSCGGIVFHARDLHWIAGTYGIITDQNLKVIDEDV